jgi:hypothetical protein
MVFTKKYTYAREAVFVINEGLRKLHLNIQGGKTEILDGVHNIRNSLDNPDFNKVNETYKRIESMDAIKDRKDITNELKKISKVRTKFTQKLKRKSWKLSTEENKVFRRILTVYGKSQRPQLFKCAVCAFKEIPELRMCSSVLRYFSRLPYSYHSEVVETLLAIAEKKELHFEYQIGCIIETITHLHPKDPKGVASRVRKIGWENNKNWYVKCMTIQTIACYPYREDFAMLLAKEALKDTHPWVRRAGCMLIARSPIKDMEEQTYRLIYDVDPSVNRLGLFLYRHLTDHKFALEELERISNSPSCDRTFCRNIYRWWLLRASRDKNTRDALIQHIKRYNNSKSVRVKWHIQKIRESFEEKDSIQ